MEWTAWRQGAGYSRPVPPEPDSGSGSGAGPGSGPAKPGSHEKPAPRHPYQDRVPNQASPPPDRREDFWAPRRSSESPRSYPPAESHEEPGTYQPPRSGPDPYSPSSPAAFSGGSSPAPEPSAYQAPSYEEPETYEVPKPRPYVSAENYDPPAGYGDSLAASGLGRPGDEDDDLGSLDDLRSGADAGEPASFGEPAAPRTYDEPIDYRPDDADSGPRTDDEDDDFDRFWNEGRGGGAHASPSPASRTPVPPPPGDTSIYRTARPNRQYGLLAVVAAVVVAAAVVAGFLFAGHSPSHHPTAGGKPSGARSPSSPVSTPPSATGASGHLGVPGSIGPLLLNSSLTEKFVGTTFKKQEANSFLIADSDVVSGFYTADPTATKFSSSDPRLMFVVAYLAGTGNASSALHEFMTNHTFTGQQQISAGPQGGEAACGQLPQAHASPVAHCMWADGNTYADFYAWNSSTSSLAKTMIGIRPKIELSHS
jgi:hypothetical protein